MGDAMTLPDRSLTKRESAAYWRTRGLVKAVWIKRGGRQSFDQWLAARWWARALRSVLRLIFGSVA